MKDFLRFLVVLTAMGALAAAIDGFLNLRKERHEIQKARAEKYQHGLEWTVAESCYAAHGRAFSIGVMVIAHFILVVIHFIYSVLNP